MNRKFPNKKYSETIHARRRAEERYGIKLNSKGRIAIIRMIQRGEKIRSRKLTNRLTEHILMFEDNLIRIVYDKERHNIVTFLPLKKEIKSENNF
jgi:hypothetical protein